MPEYDPESGVALLALFVALFVWCVLFGGLAWWLDNSRKALVIGVMGGPAGVLLVFLMVYGAELIERKRREGERGHCGCRHPPADGRQESGQGRRSGP